MKKKNEEGGYDFWPEHYRFYGKSFKIDPQAHVLIVLCDNCNENHACNYNNCELVYDKRGQIQTIHLVNLDADEKIWIPNRQTIETIYKNYPSLLYGNGTIISENYFFTHVTQHPDIDECTKKICIFSPTKSPLINIHCNNKHQQILCQLACGWTYFCVCHPLKNNKFYFYSTSDHVLISMQCRRSNIQYYILSEKNTPPSLFHLSLSSVTQHNLNHILDKKFNILPNTIYKKIPNCHQRHLLPFGMRHHNIKCTGNGAYSPLICNW